jgi:hypothetical protein
MGHQVALGPVAREPKSAVVVRIQSAAAPQAVAVAGV